jgi:hypothetical protein
MPASANVRIRPANDEALEAVVTAPSLLGDQIRPAVNGVKRAFSSSCIVERLPNVPVSLGDLSTHALVSGARGDPS